MIRLTPLASGSKGNAFLLETSDTKVLLDCGLSTKALQERLKKIGVRLDQLHAILITHEHFDHIQGLKVIGKSEIPVFCNKETAKGIYHALQVKPKFKIFSTNESFSFRGIQFHPFSIQHDTLDPVGLVLEVGEKKIGVCTDLGMATSLVRAKLKGCDLLVLEANHDPEMVQLSNRSERYKTRVQSQVGHLSNQQCAELLKSLLHKKLQAVVLSHLSQECNRNELVIRTIQSWIAKEDLCPLLIASQEKVSESISLA